MTEPNLCPQCGSEIPSGSPAGLCPKCLVLIGLESQPPVDAEPQPTQPSPPAAPSGFVPPTAEALAERLPQLEIVELLGRGGMGAVYKARQTELDRPVAIKILPPEVSADPAFAERFTREARALARLSHPNIVAVHDFGRTGDGLFYFVMEYVDGVNLRQAIQSGGMSPKEALAIVPQICDALQFAHDEGIVHRDIKPENILIDKKGRVKIADFGLAKLLGHAPGDVSLTGTQQVMGTLRYMAPEQIEGTKAVDHRADIYSLGVVFYELLTGELPIGRFAPPSKKVQIDVRLDEVVLRALEKEPEQRYQHVSEVKTEVEAIRSSAPALAPAQAAPAPAASVPDAVLRRLLTILTLAQITIAEAAFLGLQAGYLARAPWYAKQEFPYGWMSSWFGVFAAMGGACLVWWWYLLAKSPETSRSFADFLRTMQGPDSRVKRLWLPLGIFLGAYAAAILADAVMDLDDAASTVIMTIPYAVGPYVLMAVLWRIYHPAGAPVVEMPPSRRSLWRRARLLVTLAVWTGVLVGAFGYLPGLIWNEWWPWAYKEHWAYQLKPQSGAYKIGLRAERWLYCWGQHSGDRLIAKGAWTATAEIGAEIGLRVSDANATLELDPFLEYWQWTPPVGQSKGDHREPEPEFVAQWMKAAGIDVSKPGVQEEAAALIGLVKDAANGVVPGGKHPRDSRVDHGSGAKIGPFIRNGSLNWWISLGEEQGGGAIGPVDRRLVWAALFLAIWPTGIAIIVRRHRRRLAAAHETEQRYRLGTIGFWATLVCFLGTLASCGPWILLLSPTGVELGVSGAYYIWYGIVSVLAFFTVLLLCFLTDFFRVRRSWQPRAMIVAGALVVIAAGILFWRLTGPPATVRVVKTQDHNRWELTALVSTPGSWRECVYARGSWTEDNPIFAGSPIPKTLEQRSAPGLPIALALGLVLLVLGGVSIRRARHGPAESPGPPGDREPRRLAAVREKEPERRYQHVGKVRTDVDRIRLSGAPAAAVAPHESPPVLPPAVALPQMLGVAMGLVLGMLSATVGVLLVPAALMFSEAGSGPFWGWMGGAFGSFFGGLMVFQAALFLLYRAPWLFAGPRRTGTRP